MIIKKYNTYYNKYGFITIPLHGKKPFYKDWTKLTKSKELKNEDENIGVLTGSKSNITVIDIDLQDDGLKIWKQLIKIYGDPKTVKVKTPSGSLHYYFKYDKDIKSSNKIKINNKKYGIDVLNDGRQVVLPPSIHPDFNKEYKFINSIEKFDIIEMPNWIKSLVL